MKRLLCFFDGTWNSPDDKDGITNVVKLCRAVPDGARDGVRQVVRYIVGIATEDIYRDYRFAAGAIGVGVSARIKAGLAFLTEHYEPGDEIYLFGFSRGAYEARSVAGLVSFLGMPRRSSEAAIEDAWSCYRRHVHNPDMTEAEGLRSRHHYPARIRLVGVWDTVGNLGVPFAPGAWLSEALAFSSSELSPNVDVGLHALSIDEPRGSFSPTLWTRRKADPPPSGQIVEQVWFPGCHANIGGGYRDSSLSDISLLWMAERAAATTGVELDLRSLHRAAAPNPLGEAVLPTSDRMFRVNNVLPYIRLIGQDTRAIPALRRAVLGTYRANRVARGDVVVNETVHESAAARFGHRVPVRYGDAVVPQIYKPRTLANALRLS